MKWRLMPLDNPTKLERLFAWIKTPKGVKVALYCLGGIVLLGIVLYIASATSEWWSGRQIDKLKANVNAATKELEQSQANVAKAKQEEQLALQNVNAAVADYTTKTNATDAAKAETDRALRNMANAVNANRNVNLNISDLEKRLNEIP